MKTPDASFAIVVDTFQNHNMRASITFSEQSFRIFKTGKLGEFANIARAELTALIICRTHEPVAQFDARPWPNADSFLFGRTSSQVSGCPGSRLFCRILCRADGPTSALETEGYECTWNAWSNCVSPEAFRCGYWTAGRTPSAATLPWRSVVHVETSSVPLFGQMYCVCHR